MPDLIETYARSTGLKIDNMWVKEQFWPLPFERYITLSAGSGQAAKNYSYWQLVIDMLNPIVSPLGIHIIQLGDDQTQLFSGTYDLRGKMSVSQAAYLVKRAALHMGNDSWSVHASGHFKTPLLSLYGTTSINNHGPHWKSPEKTVLLEAHRSGRKPTFGAEGNPKSIDTIPPEDAANAALKLLGLEAMIGRRTQFIGPLHQHTIFDWLPNSAPSINLSPDVPISVRLDLMFSEQNLVALLQSGRKVTLITDRPINLNILSSFRQNILSYSHLIDVNCPIDYVINVKRLLKNVVFFTRETDAQKVAALRFHFFDICGIEHVPFATKADYLRESASYLNKPLDNLATSDRLYLTTNKFIMSKGKIYLSYAHEAADLPTPSIEQREAQVIDDKQLWRDSTHYHIYTKD